MMSPLRFSLLLLLLTPPLQLFASETLQILSSNSAAHRQFVDLLKQKIKHEDLLPSSTTHQLRITIGVEALERALNSTTPSPVLALLVTRDEFIQAVNHTPSPLVTAIYREQPIHRLINLTQIATPTLQRVALLTSSHPFSPLSDTPQLVLHDTDSLRSAIQNILPTVDALITHHNPQLYNRKSFKQLLLSSYRQQKPLICHTQAMVTAGCILSTYSSPAQLIEEATDWITEFQQNTNAEHLFQPRYSSYFNVAVNHKVARSLGHHLPHPDLLLQQLHQLETETP